MALYTWDWRLNRARPAINWQNRTWSDVVREIDPDYGRDSQTEPTYQFSNDRTFWQPYFNGAAYPWITGT